MRTTPACLHAHSHTYSQPYLLSAIPTLSHTYSTPWENMGSTAAGDGEWAHNSCFGRWLSIPMPQPGSPISRLTSPQTHRHQWVTLSSLAPFPLQSSIPFWAEPHAFVNQNQTKGKIKHTRTSSLQYSLATNEFRGDWGGDQDDSAVIVPIGEAPNRLVRGSESLLLLSQIREANVLRPLPSGLLRSTGASAPRSTWLLSRLISESVRREKRNEGHTLRLDICSHSWSPLLPVSTSFSLDQHHRGSG